MIKEFKEFISRGNVLDLAVAVILAGAFGKIISALVDKVLMPVVGMIVGQDFSTLEWILQEGTKNAEGVLENQVALGYGSFIQAIIDFLIVAFVIFLVVKAYNKTQKAEEEAPAAPAEDITLLTEIRDLLKK